MFSERIFAGYGIGVYNETGIVYLLNGHTFPLTIWQGMAKEVVEKAQQDYEDGINSTRNPGAQIKGVQCFT